VRRVAGEFISRLGDLAHLWAVVLWTAGEDVTGD
jgi:hypothetical protein